MDFFYYFIIPLVPIFIRKRGRFLGPLFMANRGRFPMPVAGLGLPRPPGCGRI